MAQNPKGGGLSSTFGGASSAQFGVQRTNDFMEKATWTLGASVVLVIILSVVLTASPVQSLPKVQTPKKTEAPVSAPTSTPSTAPTSTPAK